MEFSKEDLQALAWDEHDLDKYEIVLCELVDTTRWSVIYEQVFRVKDTGLLYSTSYSSGATEQQDEEPYEYEKDTINCPEVFAVQVEVTQYQIKEEK